MSHLTRAGTGIVCAAMLSAVAACSAGHADAKEPTRHPRPSAPATAPVSAPAPAAPGATRPSSLTPPEPAGGEALAGRRKVTAGNAALAYGEGRKGDALFVEVRCQGAGKLEVVLRTVHVSFPLECAADEVSTIHNQLAVKGADREGVASVAAPATVRWSMTIGREAPAREESTGVD
ncbi:hypothetical protein OIB37_06335 [Streptomyces sp. NBC_00820]|uniref:hypothetical protein n=1 Tax=Streptomyces sp. NBC_00820 TaxID=2975842 RepID=UPI002ED21E21|nr:hypothetical protein OIB37_06335 [Streptomyces sp. NBC_00820]